MTDTGPVPGEGLPETPGAEAVHQPHADRPVDTAGLPPAPGAVWHPDGYQPAGPGYTFIDQQEGTDLPGGIEDDDDLLLMPAPQGSWGGDPQPVPPQPAMPVPSAAEAPAAQDAGPDFGGTEFGAVPAAESAGAAPQPPAPRRPLHLGPPVPDPTIGVSVRSLADRGPTPVPAAAAQTVPAPGPAPVLPAAGPEYADLPAGQPPVPGGQLPEAPVTGGPWAPSEPAAAQAAEPQPAPLPEPPAPEVRDVPPAGPVPQPAVAEAGPAAAPGAVVPTAEPEAPQPAEAGPQSSRTGAFLADDAPAQVLSGMPAAPAPQPAGDPAHIPAANQDRPALAPQAAGAPPLSGVPETAADAPAAVHADSAAGEASSAAAAPDAAQPAQGGAAPTAPEAVPVPEAAVVPEAVPVPEAAVAPEAVPVPEAAVVPEAVPASEALPAAGSAEQDGPGAQAAPLQPAAPEAAEASAEAGEAAGQPDAAETGESGEAAGQPDAGLPGGQSLPDAAGDRPSPAPAGAPAPPYDDAVREAVHRVIRERRDIRNGFRPDPIPHDVLIRVLEAAHTAPSVGHSQPWDFVVIRSAATREKMHALAMKQREAYAASLPRARAKQFRELKIEAILDTPVNIVVTADPTRGGRHTLGRHTQPQMAPYSSALAVENLWLAARAEGLGVGWVSFFDEREMVRELGLPDHLEVVAYLCVGYVEEFPADPELMQAGWSKRRPLSWVVHEEEYGRRALPGEEPHDLIDETLRGIRPLDAKALGEAWERQKRMTKPAGALGMLEIISAQLCGLSRQCPPPIPEPAAVAIFAGDHGVHAQGVTAWPQEVTAQMVANFLAGGAVSNAFASQVGAEVCVVDVGVAADLPTTPGLLPRKVRHGTGDFTTGPAMAAEDALRAIEVGIETARDLVAAGNKALLTGEMGIANTTASAALIAVFTGADPSEVTGRGTGINDEMHARKVEVVRRALELHRPDPSDPLGALAAVGGLEHAAMVGLILGGASLRTPVILDGVSAGAAALVARAIAPEALAACIAGHRSAEPGHVAALTKLGLRPLVDLDLRLGEGTGALLALPLVQSAARVMHEVATFDAAGVTEKN